MFSFLGGHFSGSLNILESGLNADSKNKVLWALRREREWKLYTETNFIHREYMHPIHTCITYNFTTVSHQFPGVNQSLVNCQEEKYEYNKRGKYTQWEKTVSSMNGVGKIR